MKNNFFKTKSNSEKQLKSEFINAENLEESELLQYDKNVDFFYTNLINSLILFTYNSEELEKMPCRNLVSVPPGAPEEAPTHDSFRRLDGVSAFLTAIPKVSSI